jgi:hypothetical protein
MYQGRFFVSMPTTKTATKENCKSLFFGFWHHFASACPTTTEHAKLANYEYNFGQEVGTYINKLLQNGLSCHTCLKFM